MGGKQSKAKAAAQGKSTPSPNKAAASPSTTAPVAAPPPVPTPARPAASLTSSPDASATASRSTTPFAPCLHEYKQFCETLLTAYEDVAEACFQDRPDWSAVKWAAFRLDCLLFESDSRRTQLANEPPCGVCTRRAATISNELDDLRELLELARSAAKLQDIYTVISPPEEGSLSGVASYQIQ